MFRRSIWLVLFVRILRGNRGLSSRKQGIGQTVKLSSYLTFTTVILTIIITIYMIITIVLIILLLLYVHMCVYTYHLLYVCINVCIYIYVNIQRRANSSTH